MLNKFKAAAIAVIAAQAGGTVVARAADMILPPLEASPMVEMGGGWYLRGDVGYATQPIPGFAYPSTDPVTLLSTPPSPLLSDQMRHVGLFTSSAGVGYAFSRWFRSDVTFDWRQPFSGSSTQSYVPQTYVETLNGIQTPYQQGGCGFSATTETSCYKLDKSTLASWSVMANVYGDLGTWGGLTPYVGAGVGVTELTARSSENFYFSNGAPYSSNGYNNTYCPSTTSGSTCYVVGYPGATGVTRTNFSWALMAGVSYDVLPHVKLDLGYRFLDMGNLPVATATGLIVHKEFDTQEVRLGLRFTPDL